MTACCGARGQLSVHECFQRGLRTRRQPPLPHVGERVARADGLWACFSFARSGGVLTAVRFECSSCTTLVAYCQALCELIPGADAGAESALDPRELIRCLPGVPGSRQDRAVLALAALRAALSQAVPHSDTPKRREDA